MNEQFERLALRAGFNLHNDVMDGHSLHHEIEKFAQLIVRECIRVDEENRDAAPGVEIARHFGV